MASKENTNYYIRSEIPSSFGVGTHPDERT